MRPTGDQLLTTREVAARLRVSPATVTRWRSEGVIKALKIGGTVRFYADDVERLLESSKEATG